MTGLSSNKEVKQREPDETAKFRQVRCMREYIRYVSSKAATYRPEAI